MNTWIAILTGAAAISAVMAIPVLSQPANGDPSVPSARADGNIDVNSGRFLTFGGAYGELRVDCIRCHEIDGSGNSSGAFPRLADQSAWYLYKTLLDYAAGLRPSKIMQPIAAQLTDEETQKLAAYYASVEDAPYPAEPVTDVNVLQQGGAIAAIGIPGQGVPACVTCHGPNGIGSPPIYPYLAGQFASYLENQLTLWKTGRRGGDPMNIMAVIAKNMTEEQIRAVSLYFSSVRQAEVTPDEASFRDPEAMPIPRSADPRDTDMGAIQNLEPGGANVIPSAELGTDPAPQIDLPTGLPRRPLPPGALTPEPGAGLDSTTTTTGERPADGNVNDSSAPVQQQRENTGD